MEKRRMILMNENVDVIHFIIHMADGRFDVSDRIRIINKWIKIAEVKGAFGLVENWLIEKSIVSLNKQKNPFIVDRNNSDISMIAHLLSDTYEVDQCSGDSISELIIANKDSIDSIKCCLEDIYPVLNGGAKHIVDSMHKIENVFQLIKRGYSGDIPENCDEFSIVESYLEEKTREKDENKKNGIISDSFPSVEEYIGKVAAYMFIRNYPSAIAEKFYGVCDEYDFLLNPLGFKQDDFRLEWLLKYSDNLLKKLKECKIQKQIIIESIEKAFEGTALSQLQLKRLFRIYQIMEKH